MFEDVEIAFYFPKNIVESMKIYVEAHGLDEWQAMNLSMVVAGAMLEGQMMETRQTDRLSAQLAGNLVKLRKLMDDMERGAVQ